MSEELTKQDETGFRCECGTRHDYDYDAWVAAHCRIHITHTCETCDAQHAIFKYKVKILKRGKDIKSV